MPIRNQNVSQLSRHQCWKKGISEKEGGEICYRQLYFGVAFMDVVVYSKLMELPGTDLQ